MGKIELNKYSPKLIELTKWKKIETLNKKLDKGESPSSCTKWLNTNGFKISAPMVYDYARLRKQAILEGISVIQVFNPIKVVPILSSEKDTEEFKEHNNKVKNEMEVLDLLISQGYQTLVTYRDRPVPPKLMMDAIALKNKLTEGSHMGLTEYGIEHLRTIEQGKFQAVLQVLLDYVPEERRDDAIDAIDRAEDEYYRGTDYYDDYLSLKNGLNRQPEAPAEEDGQDE